MASLTSQRCGFLSAVGSDSSRCLFAGRWRLHVDDSSHAGSVLLCNNQKFVFNHSGKKKDGTTHPKHDDQQVLDLLICYIKLYSPDTSSQETALVPITISSIKKIQNSVHSSQKTQFATVAKTGLLM